MTYFAAFNSIQTALSYILITIKTVPALIDASLAGNRHSRANGWCGQDRSPGTSRPERQSHKVGRCLGRVMSCSALCLQTWRSQETVGNDLLRGDGSGKLWMLRDFYLIPPHHPLPLVMVSEVSRTRGVAWVVMHQTGQKTTSDTSAWEPCPRG